MKITLSTGMVIDVRPVPPFALAEIERHYTFPVLEGTELAQAQAARERMTREAAWLMALPDVTVPDDWQFPRGLRYAGIQPREGDDGLLLDYIEFGVLIAPSDIQAVQAVMYSSDLTEEEIGAAEATFPAIS